MKKTIISILIIIVGIYSYIQENPSLIPTSVEGSVSDNQAIKEAYEKQLSDTQVNGSGKVSRLLKDDNEGSRHQRFILSLSSGQKILIAHNIDLAAKIKTLQKGDIVEFFGEYEWNAKGGVVHWTHHDPGGRHVGGWLKHDGKKYQ